MVSKGASFPAIYDKQITPLNTVAQALPMPKGSPVLSAVHLNAFESCSPSAAVRSPLPAGRLGLRPCACRQRGPGAVFQGALEQPLPRDFCTLPEGAGLLLSFRDLP